MNSRAATRLALSFGLLCAALVALSLPLLVLNGSTTLMTMNRPEGGFEYRVVEAIVESTFPQAGPSNTYLFFVNLAFAVTFMPMGVLISSRRPSNSVGWLFCVVGLLAGILVFADQYTVYALLTEPGSLPGGAVAAWLASWVWLPEQTAAFILLPLLFPNGHPPTRRWRIVVWLAIIQTVMLVTYVALLPGPMNEDLPMVENPFGVRGAGDALEIWFGVGAVFGWACVLASAVALVYRLRRSDGQERQQLKWFAYAATLAALTLVAGSLARGFASYDVVGTALQFAFIPLLPVVVAIAILKHHLYDIDVLINRTLVYGILSLALVFVYLVSVVVLQQLLRALTGGESQLTIVASTLAIAALFNPLRRLIQRFIDRRFYRRKYDASLTLQEFGHRLRRDVDLDDLEGDLMVAIHKTMQPEHASLWLRDIPENAKEGRE